MLVFPFHAEEREEHQEHKQIIHRQRFLYQITRQELHRLLMRVARVEVIDAYAEDHRHGNPYDSHLQGLADTDLMLTFLAKRLQVDDQHDEHQHIEQYPCPKRHTHNLHFFLLSF